MSTFNTRCPSCHSLNRVPEERITESPNCGKCQSALLDGAPIEGTEANFSALLQSDKPVVVDFWAPWCNPCVGFAPIFSDVAAERKGQIRCVKLILKRSKILLHIFKFAVFPPLWCSKMANAST